MTYDQQKYIPNESGPQKFLIRNKTLNLILIYKFTLERRSAMFHLPNFEHDRGFMGPVFL